MYSKSVVLVLVDEIRYHDGLGGGSGACDEETH